MTQPDLATYIFMYVMIQFATFGMGVIFGFSAFDQTKIAKQLKAYKDKCNTLEKVLNMSRGK